MRSFEVVSFSVGMRSRTILGNGLQNSADSHLRGARSYSAPFWFDLLKQVIPVRVAGIKPKSSTPHRQTAVPDAQTDRR